MMSPFANGKVHEGSIQKSPCPGPQRRRFHSSDGTVSKICDDTGGYLPTDSSLTSWPGRGILPRRSSATWVTWSYLPIGRHGVGYEYDYKHGMK